MTITSNIEFIKIVSENDEFSLNSLYDSEVITEIVRYELHTHNISDINNLQITLDSKLNNNSTINCGTFE